MHGVSRWVQTDLTSAQLSNLETRSVSDVQKRDTIIAEMERVCTVISILFFDLLSCSENFVTVD